MIKVNSTKGECETKDNKTLQQNEDVIDGLFFTSYLGSRRRGAKKNEDKVGGWVTI